MTSMLIGISPELELALYTLCFKARAGRPCKVSLGDHNFTIITDVTNSDPAYLRSARFKYPIYKKGEDKP